MLVLVGIMFAMRENIAGEGFVFLTFWGFALDMPRWWLLRSHFRNAQWWLLLCALGWLMDTFILLAAGIATLDWPLPPILFIAVNGAINGAWMGFCRGVALTVMMGDRDRNQTKARSFP